jgi:hypothetical protein
MLYPLIDLLLDKKRDPEQEYTLHLFEYCNLTCQFCWQDHDALVGIDTVPDKIKPIFELLDAERRSAVCFNIMGGEIFADEVFPKLYNQYLDLAKALKSKCSQLNKELKINWVTNLVNTNSNLIRQLIDDCNKHNIKSELSTSYDPKGRFNKSQFLNFKVNLYSLKDIVGTVSILLTKTNINHFISNKDNFLDQLYNDKFYIYFDYYMPDKNWKYSAPSDQDMYDFFTYCVDNYPRVEPVNSWILNQSNYASCRSSKLVIEDGTKCNCGNLVMGEKDVEPYTSTIRPNNNLEIENWFLEKYNCVSCEYLNKCSFGCFMERNNKYLETMNDCVFKETFKYIDTKELLPLKRKKVIPIVPA